MRELLEFQLPGGSTVVAEVDVPEAELGVVRASTRRDMVVQAGKSFDDAIEIIQPIARGLGNKLRDAGEHLNPEEITAEFGIKLSVQAGAIIASSTAEANIKVALKWTRNGASR